MTTSATCLGRAIASSSAAGPAATATAAFRSYQGGPLTLVEYLASFTGSGAAGSFARAKSALDACSSASATVQGVAMSATFARTGPLGLGNQSASFEGRLVLGTHHLHANMALVRQGKVLLVVVTTTTANPYPAELRTYTSDALAKLTKVGVS